MADASRVFRCYVSMAEELELSPALMIYLAGCNFRCRFCIQAPACHQANGGTELTEPELIDRIEAAASSVRWLNWVGGEPSLHAPALIEIARRLQTPTPWLLNTNGYFTPECRDMIDHLFDLYLVDFKFGTDACAMSLANVSHYLAILQRNLRDIYATGPHRLFVRHLVMPGHEQCCLEPVAEWVAANLPGVRFHLMSSYVPGPSATSDPVLGRTVSLEAVARADAYCRGLGLNLVDQDAAPFGAGSARMGGCSRSSASPNGGGEVPGRRACDRDPGAKAAGLDDMQVSVGPDGRLYFHDLDNDLIDVALAVNPADPAMRRRRSLCEERCRPAREESS